jgi:periplasmic protein TonB
MAPILKELEAPVATTTSAPAAPHSKPANEAPARPQPVALEIPVTVNGARTVDGSEKRVPFSESTQTVLVFPHGAVIRITTPLTSGQLVFLTNEKTKKEVVCQVVKSKSTGTAGAYVELQFTEASAGFWGLQIPGASAAPLGPRPVAPAPTAAPKPIAPPASVATKPPVTPKPVAPVAISAPPAKPVVPPPPPPIVHPAPVAPQSESVATATPTPSIPVVAPPPVAATPPVVSEFEPVKSMAPVDAAPHASAPVVHDLAIPVPPLRDYAKEISALFAVPQAPPTPAPPERHPASAPPDPSTEELKLQAARLQAQLSSLLFTETPSASPASPTSTIIAKPGASVAEGAKKVLEITQEPAKPVIQNEPMPTSPARKPSPSPLGVDEEVKIPSWLAPLSQNSESTIVDSATLPEAPLDHPVSVNSEESYDALVADAPRRPQTAVFGGQLLGESAAEVSSTGSKKGLFLGLAAAALLVAGGGWYYYQDHSGSTTTVAAARPTNVPVSAAPAPTSNVPANPAVSTPAPNKVTSSPAPSSQPPKNSTPVPAPVVSAPPPKNSNSAPKEAQPVEAPPKPSLGDVHLVAPVVNHTAASQQEGDALQSIDTKTVPAGADPFDATGSHHNPPAAPLPVGGDVKPAQLLKSVPPEYPVIAKSQHVSGKVQIDALIDASGNVSSVKVLSGPTLLHRAAIDAVKQWKYSPAVLDGEPTSMHLTVTVEFRGQ